MRLLHESASSARFEIVSAETAHARGALVESRPAWPARDPAQLRAGLTEHIDGASFYREIGNAGYELGASFRWPEEIWRVDGELVGRFRAPRGPECGLALHPGAFDACLQLAGVCLDRRGFAALVRPGEVLVPTAFDRIEAALDAAAPAWCHVKRSAAGDSALDFSILSEDGRVIASVAGFRGRAVNRDLLAGAPAERTDLLYRIEWVTQPVAQPPRGAARYLLVSVDELRDQVAGRLVARGNVCSVAAAASEAFREETPRDVVFIAHGERPWLPLLDLAQAIVRAGFRDAPRLWVVTRGAVALPGEAADPVAGALSGFCRTLAHEHPELRCTAVDIGGGEELEALLAELDAGEPETAVALRGGKRYVARLHGWKAIPAGPPSETWEPAGGRAFRVEAVRGLPHTLALREAERPAPGDGEVEIAVRAAGLNFLDVLAVHGAVPDPFPLRDGISTPGLECAGVVTRTGAGVTSLAPGDEVVALAPLSFGRYAVTRAGFAVRKPPALSFEQAASVPVAFLTAWYALHELARIQPGERVLIHAASGGVGLAAAALCRRAGAEIFGTAGSEAKRNYLRSAGVKRVFDSRSPDFAEHVRAATAGEGGVDVVLNSLSGDFLGRSFDLLRPFGRFIEIGKRDYLENRRLGRKPFLRNLSYTLFDLAGMARERPDAVAKTLRHVVSLLEARELHPLPVECFEMAEAGKAFEFVSGARHIGKVVLTLGQPAAVPVAVRQRKTLFGAHETHLITGGLGGLGLALAEWMAAYGARHLVLLGRHSPHGTGHRAIDRLRDAGVDVHAIQADVSDRASLEDALHAVDASMPPLKGIFHCAAVLEDSLILHLDAAKFGRVMAPKLDGSWNLHLASRGRPIEHFVLFSSAAAVLGSPGQANYAAANAAMDALAGLRRAQGEPALSINWGPWAEMGLAAAEARRGERLAGRGVPSLLPAEAFESLALLLRAEPVANVAVMPLDLRQWKQFYGSSGDLPLLADLGAGKTAMAARGQFAKTLETADPDRRMGLLEAHVKERIGAVLRMPAARIDADTPLASLGFDSLMALEFRNRLEVSTGLRLPATIVWRCGTVLAMVDYLAEKLGYGARRDASAQAAAAAVGGAADGDPAIDALPEAEIRRLLAESIEALPPEFVAGEAE